MQMMIARVQDAMEIWDGSPMPCGFWLKLKASICIALGREALDTWQTYGEHIPIWCSGQSVSWGYDGPQCHWMEVSVYPGLRNWKYHRYTNGF